MLVLPEPIAPYIYKGAVLAVFVNVAVVEEGSIKICYYCSAYWSMFNNEQDFSLKEFFSPVSALFSPLTTGKAINIIVIVGIIVFGNVLFNDFIGDDKIYIINDPQTNVVNIALWFGKNDFNTLGQYRPLPQAYFSILYILFGATPFPYHIMQLLLHIAATALLYVLFRKFLSPSVALLSALVFLIHPMQVESVSYIAQTVSPLFFLLGIIPLILSIDKKVSAKKLGLTFFLVLLSLFVKEKVILFFVLMAFYSLLFSRKALLKLSIRIYLGLV